MTHRKPPGWFSALRGRAEAEIARRGASIPLDASRADLRRLVHELQMRHIELEVQNEELRRTQLALAEARDYLSELYDFAPVGYVTCNEQAKICDANLMAARMFGVERRILPGQRLSHFIDPKSQDAFYLHFHQVFSGDLPGTCQIILRPARGWPATVQLQTALYKDSHSGKRRCRMTLTDVTARTTAEAQVLDLNISLEERVNQRTAELRAANLQLEHLLTSSPAIVYTRNPSDDHGMKFVSANFRRHLGHDTRALLDDPAFWIKHVHPEDQAAVIAGFDRLAQAGRQALEFRFLHGDGTYRWLHDEMTLLKDPQGRAEEIVGSWLDITDRKEAERVRAELAAIVQSSNDAIIGHALDGRIISWNEASERLFGYPAAEALGRPFHFLVPPEEIPELQDINERVLKGERTEHYETKRLARDGRTIEVDSTSSLIRDGHGRIVGVSVIMRDITGRKWAEAAARRSEAAMVDFFAEAPLGLLWVTGEGRIARVNQAQLALVGRGGEDLFGRPVADLFADGEVVASMLERLASRQPIHENLVRLRYKDGSVRHALIDANGLWEEGKLVHSRWFVRDVTRRLELEREILAAGERVRRRIGQDLHDDLCQQLTSIEYLARALERRLDQGAPKHAAGAREVAELTRQAISRTRELAHGLAPMELEDAGLADALQNLAARTRRLTHVDCRFRAGSPVRIDDPVAQIYLYRIAQEAITNAMKHGKARRIDIGLDRKRGQLLLSVRDNGDGLPEGVRPEGGLGLRIMNYRAGAMGGAVTVHRRPEGGTIVLCSLPIAAAK